MQLKILTYISENTIYYIRISNESVTQYTGNISGNWSSRSIMGLITEKIQIRRNYAN